MALRWIVPLFGDLERLDAFLKNSNLEACYPVSASTAAFQNPVLSKFLSDSQVPRVDRFVAAGDAKRPFYTNAAPAGCRPKSLRHQKDEVIGSDSNVSAPLRLCRTAARTS